MNVARTHQCTKVVPNLGNVRVQADSAGVRIKRIAVLVYLVIKNTNRAPEGRISSIPIDCLLIGFVGLRELLLCHVTTAQQIPALCIFVVWHHSELKEKTCWRADTCRNSRIAPGIQLLGPGSGSCCFAGGVANQAVVRPLHASNLVLGRVCMRAWHSRTVVALG